MVDRDGRWIDSKDAGGCDGWWYGTEFENFSTQSTIHKSTPLPIFIVTGKRTNEKKTTVNCQFLAQAMVNARRSTIKLSCLVTPERG
jgi:hypothetical protein